MLASRFAEQTARRYRLPLPVFTDDARAAMLAYDWPGNVRELKHLVERAVMLSQGQEIRAVELGLGDMQRLVAPTAESDPLAGLTLEVAERQLIQAALDATAGNVSEAARRLGVSRMTLRYRMQKHGLGGE